MDISVIICTHNRANELTKTLDSFCEINIPEYMDVELIITDNASDDETWSVIKNYKHPLVTIRGIREPQSGKSKALNLSVKESSGTVLLFADDDVRFPYNWIEEMSRPILSGMADAVAGGVSLAPKLEKPGMTRWHKELFGSTKSTPIAKGKQFYGANMAVLKSVFHKIDGYDEKLGPGGYGLGGAEDTHLALQIRKNGFRILPRLDICVEHHPDQSLFKSENLRIRAKHLGRSEAYISYHLQNRRWPKWKLVIGLIYYRFRIILFDISNKNINKNEFEFRRKLARIRQHLIEMNIDSN